MSDFDFMAEFAYEQAVTAPVADRIRVYRGAASVMSDETRAKNVLRLATDLELAEQRHAELSLHFTPSTNSK